MAENDENKVQRAYSWAKSADSPHSMERDFTNLERMFVILNEKLHGQNTPFMGACISVRGRQYTSEQTPFNVSLLHSRAIKALCQTRWKYPTVAARIFDNQRMGYSIENRENVERWANRAVLAVSKEGGWLSLREQLSRESSLPTPDNDCCLFYIIVSPEEARKPELENFDVLMQVHHALIDGSGIRAVLNEFLERMTDLLPDETIVWGQETPRLLPAAIVLSKTENSKRDGVVTVPGEGIKPFDVPDVGIPLYRPEILAVKPEHRGTQLVSYTFEDPGFLSQIKAAGRRHGVKLTSILHAAMLKSVYAISDIKPGPEDVYSSGSPMDLRNGHLLPQYCDGSVFTNLAVAIQSMTVPCNLFEVDGNGDRFWKAAECINNQWQVIKFRKDLVFKGESDAQAILTALVQKKKPSNAKPRTCPSFASDPSGSPALRGVYPLTGYKNTELVLNSYQLSSEQMQTVVSARSHSWNGLLTLCLVFNAVRNPREKMQIFLEKWCDALAEAGKDTGSYGHSEKMPE